MLSVTKYSPVCLKAGRYEFWLKEASLQWQHSRWPARTGCFCTVFFIKGSGFSISPGLLFSQDLKAEIPLSPKACVRKHQWSFWLFLSFCVPIKYLKWESISFSVFKWIETRPVNFCQGYKQIRKKLLWLLNCFNDTIQTTESMPGSLSWGCDLLSSLFDFVFYIEADSCCNAIF